MSVFGSFAFCLTVCLFSACPTTAVAQESDLPALPPAVAFEPIQFGDGKAALTPNEQEGMGPSYFGDQKHQAGITAPSQILGRPVGSWVASPDEVTRIFRRWDTETARVRVDEYGRTHEGRPLIYAVISSERNMARLEEVRAGIARLSDPRHTDPREEQALVKDLPAVAFLGYSIHGDETSGTDASLAVAYHLAACEGAEVQELLERVVIVMDPCMNPDGRARFLAQLTAGHGHVQNPNHNSMHRGRWPFGRTNHYLFDMNRDWMTGVAPETRGRWRVLSVWRPQLFVDGHEMSGLDTFLFYPQADPKHYSLPSGLFDWQALFAADCARAFDPMGWGYYTREWADAWYPAYSDSWGSLNGAIGMLYEQGRVAGQPLQRASGEVVTYREAVNGQVVASMANLFTLSDNREQILTDYVAGRRHNVDTRREAARSAFVLNPGRHPEREAHFLATLQAQGIEVFRADAEVGAKNVIDALGNRSELMQLAEGSWIVPSLQPQSPLVHAYLDFDPRIDDATLLKERKSLEKDGESKFYDISAWDLGRAWNLDARWCELISSPSMSLIQTAIELPSGVLASKPSGRVYAYVVDGDLDASVRFAGAALEAGLAVHISDKAFDAAGRSFPAGSLLLRRHENRDDWEGIVERTAESSRTPVHAVDTGRAPGEGPDMGGGHFILLERPRIALLANSPVSATDYGHVWQVVDEQLGLPATILDAQNFGSYDLRRFNVLVVPPASGLSAALAGSADDLKDWVRAGGTLITMGSSASAFTQGDLQIGSVQLRRNVLDKLDSFERAVDRERSARHPELDQASLWLTDFGLQQSSEASDQTEDSASAIAADKDAAAGEDSDGAKEDAAERDRWMRRFSPAGLILRAELDSESWITAGCAGEMPVFFRGSAVLMAKSPVSVPVRIASSERMRLGGLLWAEARERIADSAWLTVESVGSGQVIMFAAAPAYRGIFRSGARLLANAVVYGPGAGASAPLGW
ncbi:MAG: hypothetical protein ACI841_001601 [Planctomycetota bacterium]|jgi:hypothetical protein